VTLVDTSVWVAHLRARNAALEQLLSEARVLAHPFVIGELACGNLRNRKEVLTALRSLPSAAVVENEEVLYFLEEWRLWGRGIGWIDAHLLASARLSRSKLWTLDQRLRAVSRELVAEDGVV